MDKQLLYDLLDQTESDMIRLSNTVAQLKESVENLTQENNQLRLHNHDLHSRLQAYQEASQEAVVGGEETFRQESSLPKKGQAQLQSFYDEGIHICHLYFGSRRDPGEACIFCQRVLDGLNDGND